MPRAVHAICRRLPSTEAGVATSPPPSALPRLTAGDVRAGSARQGLRYSPSIRSILKMTGLVPSEQQAIMVFSSRIQPRMMEPP